MSLYEDLPFALGSTYFGGDTSNIDANEGNQLEGTEYEIEDIDPTVFQGAAANRTNYRRRLRIVRNKSNSTISAKVPVYFKTDGTENDALGAVAGVASDATVKSYPVDDAVGTVLNNDLFYITVKGPAKVTTASGGDTNIPVGGYVIPGTAGYVQFDDTATNLNAYKIINRGGRALTAVNGTATDFYIFVGD